MIEELLKLAEKIQCGIGPGYCVSLRIERKSISLNFYDYDDIITNVEFEKENGTNNN